MFDIGVGVMRGRGNPQPLGASRYGRIIDRLDINAIEIDQYVADLLAAALRKWPSRAKERAASSIYAGPYLLFEGTLDECIQQFMSKPASQHHLYEIHTAPQPDLVRAVVSAEHIVELARLRDLFRAV